MNRETKKCAFWRCVFFCAAIALSLVACRPANKEAASAEPKEIRGELIESEVATETAPAEPVVAAPAPETPVETTTAAEQQVSFPAQTPPVKQTPGEAASKPEPAVAKEGSPKVGFSVLSAFDFEMPDESSGPTADSPDRNARVNSQIPEEVKAFDNKRVSLTGFMLPLKVEAGSVTEFLIMKDQSMCCYGTVPRINEWVSVKTVGNGVKPIMDQPVVVTGTLRVGAMRENGYLVGIYAMDGEKLVQAD